MSRSRRDGRGCRSAATVLLETARGRVDPETGQVAGVDGHYVDDPRLKRLAKRAVVRGRRAADRDAERDAASIREFNQAREDEDRPVYGWDAR